MHTCIPEHYYILIHSKANEELSLNYQYDTKAKERSYNNSNLLVSRLHDTHIGWPAIVAAKLVHTILLPCGLCSVHG